MPTRPAMPTARTAHARPAPAFVLTAALALALLGVLAPRAAAHEGPPYPLLVDEPLPPWSVSLWADPDVGVGTFYMTLEPAPGRELPADTLVTLWVMPADGRREEVAFACERTVREDDQRHVGEAEFDTQEDWSIRVVIESASTGARVERTFVEPVTPPGFGVIDLAWYAAPFLLVAFLWIKAAMKRRAYHRSQPAGASAPAPKHPTAPPPAA